MTPYVVAYDLIEVKNYQALYDELERLGGHRVQDSVWLVAVNDTAKGLGGHLVKFMDSDDRIFVDELVKNNWFKNANKGTSNWIKNNPPSR